jgi:ATP-dependent Zn protease
MDETFGLATMPMDSASAEVRTAVNRILGEEMQNAIRTIAENREKMDALVEKLMNKNSLTGPEIEEVMANTCQPEASRIVNTEKK